MKFSTLHLHKLKSKANFLNRYTTLIQPTRISCWNCSLQYHSTVHSLNLIFVKLEENDFRELQLHNLKSLPTIWFYTTLAQRNSHYIVTTWFQVLQLHNLKFLPTILYTTLTQPDFHYIHAASFQGSTPPQSEIFVDNIIVHYNHTIWFSLHWFQGSALAQLEIFIFMVKWHFSRYTHTLWSLLHSQNMISIAFLFLLCVYIFLHIHISYLYFV